MTEHGEHDELKRLIKRNTELLEQNHTLLKKLHRNSVIELVFRVLWYGLLIGLPFAVYFYFLEPYFDAVGANYETFRTGIAELPGLKGLEHLLPNFGNND
ncbi:hypothetical protein KC727_02195 [Candidatus Kaiserbacteria bacterium]|nr:hypothetical protein [Candidatus Kaiserbacteria bacterium]